jgi:hypothetical protein
MAELAAQAVVAPGALNGGGGGVGRAAPAIAILQQFESFLGQLRTQLTLRKKICLVNRIVFTKEIITLIFVTGHKQYRTSTSIICN